MKSLDLETYLIEPGLLAPRIVCGSVAEPGELVPGLEVLVRSRAVLAGTVAGANIAFDFGCLAAADWDMLVLIFRAYAEGRVHDVQVAQALDAIAGGHLGIDPRTGVPMRGRYSLETCVDQVLGRLDAKKNDFWRKRYAILERVPLAEWPEDARQYPVDDAVNTREVAVEQVKRPHRNLGDLAPQCETAFDMHLGAIWGLRTDRERVEILKEKTEKRHAEFVAHFQKVGFIKADGREDGVTVRRAVARAYGSSGPCLAGCAGGKVLSAKSGNPVNCKDCSGTGLDISGAPRTDTGGLCANRDSLTESGDFDLMAYGENEAEKIKGTYIPFLESGLDRPISLRPNVLVASGRTSYDGLIQLLPRLGGVRECFRARGAWSGSPVEYVYCSVDYSALELCTLSQVCLWLFGRSQMAETINASGNPGMLHTAFAARLSGRTTEEMTTLIKAKDADAKKKRDVAKNINFSLPGGAGPAKIVLMARGRSAGSTRLPDGSEVPGIRYCVLLGEAERCGIEKVSEWKGRPTPPICRACVELVDYEIRPAWFEQWPEIREYFAWVMRQVDAGGEFPCFGTERVRGGLSFCDGANNSFQALASDGAKNALRKLTRECYLDEASPLFGARPIMFVHDEIVAELPERTAHLAGPRMSRVMVDSMREYVPDVCIVAEPALMRFWYKSADGVYDETGKLIPWEPKEAL